MIKPLNSFTSGKGMVAREMCIRDRQISITSLSDEELKQLIQFSKYEKNQQLLQEYQNYNYSEKDEMCIRDSSSSVKLPNPF